jgi:hypothetical protein
MNAAHAVIADLVRRQFAACRTVSQRRSALALAESEHSRIEECLNREIQEHDSAQYIADGLRPYSADHSEGIERCREVAP